jgi:hypothetical protein
MLHIAGTQVQKQMQYIVCGQCGLLDRIASGDHGGLITDDSHVNATAALSGVACEAIIHESDVRMAFGVDFGSQLIYIIIKVADYDVRLGLGGEGSQGVAH